MTVMSLLLCGIHGLAPVPSLAERYWRAFL